MYTRVVLFWAIFFILHSNLIRYSVVKRYGVGPRSTASPCKTFWVPPTEQDLNTGIENLSLNTHNALL